MQSSVEVKNQLFKSFPELSHDPHFKLLDKPNPDYNCIAYAAGVLNEWWSELPANQKPPIVFDGVKYNWPFDAPNDMKLSTLIYIFSNFKYEVCSDGNYEPGYRKICIYGKSKDLASHAARQNVSDATKVTWTSKLGKSSLIQHGTPYTICGDAYGDVIQFMKSKWP
jgi:hypothetical protein